MFQLWKMRRAAFLLQMILQSNFQKNDNVHFQTTILYIYMCSTYKSFALRRGRVCLDRDSEHIK